MNLPLMSSTLVGLYYPHIWILPAGIVRSLHSVGQFPKKKKDINNLESR